MDEMYKQNARIVYHFLYAMCKDENLAEELPQETFLRAFKRIESYDSSCKLSTYDYQGDDEVGRLMNDLKCSNPKDMHSDIFRITAKYFKETEEGKRKT